MSEHVTVGRGDILGRNASHPRDDFLNQLHIDDLLARGQRLQAAIRARFVDDVDGFVGQMPVVDVTAAQLRRGAQSVVIVDDVVMLLEARLQAAQNFDGLVDRRLDDVDLLESPCEGVIFLENTAELRVRRRPDATQLAVGQHRLDQIRRVHDAAGCRAGADYRVYLVDEQNRSRLVLQFGDHALQALLEIAAVLRAGNQRTHIQRVDRAIEQHLGHVPLDDQARKPFSQCRFSDSGFTDIKRIVLAAPAQDLHRALNLELAPDQRIDAPLGGQGVQVGRETLQGTRLRRRAISIDFHIVIHSGFVLQFRNAMGNVVDDIESRDILHTQQIHGLRLLFAENRHEHVGRQHFLLSARLHVVDSSLQNALKSERRLHVHFFVVIGDQARRGVRDELQQLSAQASDLRAASLQYFDDLRRIEQCEQQVLDRHKLVALLARPLVRLLEAIFEFA